MNIDYLKSKKQFIAKTLTVLSLCLGGLMIFEVVAFGITSIRMPKEIEAAISDSEHDDEAVKQCVAKTKEVAGKLKEKNMFVPPPPKPKPPSCTGVIGDEAAINGKLYKVGDEVGGAKIVSITASGATILWEGKEKFLPAFGGEKGPPGPPALSAKRRPKRKAKSAEKKPEPEVVSEPPRERRGGGMRGMFGNMSEEERNRIRNMSPEERREYFSQMRGQRGSGGRERGEGRRRNRR